MTETHRSRSWPLRLLLACLLAALPGQTCAQQAFSSVQDAVASIPDLSELNLLLQNTNLYRQLQDTNLVGTFFAPINAGLQPLEDAANKNLPSLLGDMQHINDLFSTAVVPGEALTLDQLQDGTKLGVLSGDVVKVSVLSTQQGDVYYINKAQIVVANIPAGKAIIHKVRPLVVPGNLQDVLDALTGFQTPLATPTLLWQGVSTASGADSSTAAQSVPTGHSPEPSQAPPSTPSMTTSTTAAQMTGAAPSVAAASSTADSTSQDSDDDTHVNYNFEEDFQHLAEADQAVGSSAATSAAVQQLQSSGPDIAVYDSVQQGMSSRDAQSSARITGVRATALPSLLQLLAVPLVVGFLTWSD